MLRRSDAAQPELPCRPSNGEPEGPGLAAAESPPAAQGQGEVQPTADVGGGGRVNSLGDPLEEALETLIHRLLCHRRGLICEATPTVDAGLGYFPPKVHPIPLPLPLPVLLS